MESSMLFQRERAKLQKITEKTIESLQVNLLKRLFFYGIFEF